MRSRVVSDQVTAVINAAILFGASLALHLSRPWALAVAALVYVGLTVAFLVHRHRARPVMRFPEAEQIPEAPRREPPNRRRTRHLHVA